MIKLKDILNEIITLDVEIGDVILTGRFKNKKTIVKTIGVDDHGMPVINNRKAATFRYAKKETNEVIEKRGDVWIVLTKDRKKELGRHSTKQKALAQLRAIEINKRNI